MVLYFFKNVIQLIIIGIGITLISFVLLHLTGDPVDMLLPQDAGPEAYESMRYELGLDKPLPIQYFIFLKNAVTGNFGFSLQHRKPALDLVLERLPASLELAFSAMVIATVIGVFVGIICALKPGSIFDLSAMVNALIGQSMPIFWLGIMLIILFSVNLGLLPVSGRGTFKHLILPSVTLATWVMPLIVRLTRSSMIEILEMDYIRTAKGKGLSPYTVLTRHALSNALIPIITVVGLNFGRLLGGAIVTETVFGWPGLGRLTVTAIHQLDYSVVQASVVIFAAVIVVTNFIVDICYVLLDPRIRLS
jgi:peptide/nickel transport system permease protein